METYKVTVTYPVCMEIEAETEKEAKRIAFDQSDRCLITKNIYPVILWNGVELIPKIPWSKVKEYPFVYYWGKMLKSTEDFIKQQMDQARKDKAPRRSTFKTTYWHTIDKCKDKERKAEAIDWVEGTMKIKTK